MMRNGLLSELFFHLKFMELIFSFFERQSFKSLLRVTWRELSPGVREIYVD